MNYFKIKKENIVICLSLLFGMSAVFLQSLGKMYALALLIFLMLGVVVTFRIVENRK